MCLFHVFLDARREQPTDTDDSGVSEQGQGAGMRTVSNRRSDCVFLSVSRVSFSSSLENASYEMALCSKT